MRVRSRLKVTGTVQGVGFRPFVYQLAARNRIAGWVSNTAEGVVIEAEGEDKAFRAFLRGLRREAPRLARIADVLVEPREPRGEAAFTILDSITDEKRLAVIPADAAMCDECLADVTDPTNRRFGYPFTNCTNCGPRFTIIRGIPYDRPQTTMSAFEMCPECRREYHDPADRRFHAQPNACPVCGPRIWLEPDDGESDAVSAAGRMLADGKIVAIKGLGGFHLACDARNGDAVRELRRRKGRGRKPFAIMAADLDEARKLCRIDADEEAMVLSYERPVALLEARLDSGVAPDVAPGNLYLGLMLPYTPLHHLLFRHSPSALVMTSGNLAEEPIAYRNEEARGRLAHIADAFLMHDRDIHIGCDDSVVRPVPGEPMPIRRSRGFVPGAVDLGNDSPPILACGAEQKNTFCITAGRWAVPSQHIGDLDSAETLDYYERAIDHFTRLFDVRPEIVAHDLHPDYLSTRFAQSLEGVRRIAVQHHHAHVASCMAEHSLSGPVIGAAFDGTGYGTDGAVWGGEFLAADLTSFERAAHLRYVSMPGGAAAIRHPARMALAHLFDAFGDRTPPIAESLLGPSGETVKATARQIERRLNCPMTSSMGRLFDSVSALLGLCTEATFEGEPAAALEMSADPDEHASYSFGLSVESACVVVETRGLIREIVQDVLAGVAAPVVSARFHNTIAELVVRVCVLLRARLSLADVVLSGGCFQNVRLLVSTVHRLEDYGFRVYRHRIVPPNDGGISLGQAAVAAAMAGKGH